MTCPYTDKERESYCTSFAEERYVSQDSAKFRERKLDSLREPSRWRLSREKRGRVDIITAVFFVDTAVSNWRETFFEMSVLAESSTDISDWVISSKPDKSSFR